MNDFQPNSNVLTNELIVIANKSWPKEYFREISDIDDIKKFYNSSYKNFHEEIELILNKYHPASWVRIAYIQLELWTLRMLETDSQDKELNDKILVFSPIGRYGWRYVLEKSLEKTNDSIVELFNEQRPSDNDISKMFTLLLGLSYCAEISNFMHYFKEQFKTAKLVFSGDIYKKFPKLEEGSRLFLDELIDYYNHENIDYNLVPELNYIENQDLMSQVDLLLNDYFGFTVNEVEIVIQALKEKVVPEISATILVMPTDALICLLSEYTSLPVERIRNLVNFVFFEVNDLNYEKRDYLKKSQNSRMLNFAGCKFNLDNNFKTIYEDNALKSGDVKMFKNHSIVSFALLWEWKINFIERLIFGKRTDLKEISNDLKISITKIEDFFHRNIFENNIKNILINRGFPCRSLDEVEKNKLPCGEIDAISIDEENKIIYVIEAKNISPIKDARASGKTISDHYKQKKYHAKFLKKINWVEANFDVLSKSFKLQISEEYKVEKYFVTGVPSPMKFLVNDYIVLTYFEFFNLINKKYESN